MKKWFIPIFIRESIQDPKIKLGFVDGGKITRRYIAVQNAHFIRFGINDSS